MTRMNTNDDILLSTGDLHEINDVRAIPSLTCLLFVFTKEVFNRFSKKVWNLKRRKMSGLVEYN